MGTVYPSFGVSWHGLLFSLGLTVAFQERRAEADAEDASMYGNESISGILLALHRNPWWIF